MQLSDGRWDISRASLTADWKFFGFKSSNDANQYKTTLLDNLSFQSLNLSKIGAATEFKGILIERALHAKNNL